MRNLSMVALVLAGLLVGWYMTHNHYQGQLARMEREQARSEAERRQQLATLSRNYYDQFEAITNREPATVERRVYVKADCVPAGASAGLGNAPDAGGSETDRTVVPSDGKVELAQEAVQAIASVADRAERLYQQCVTRLQYFQDRHER